MESKDADYVMNIVKAFGADYLSSNVNNDSATLASKVIMKKVRELRSIQLTMIVSHHFY